MAELSKAIARLMEERERVPPQPVLAETPKLREVLDMVRSRVAPGERTLVDAFIRQLFEKAGAALLEEGVPSELAGLALASFRFLSERSTDEPRVMVFDPDLIDAGWETPCTVIETVMRDRPFIVDTIQDCLRQAGATVHRLLHPVFAVERDPRGALMAVGGPAALGRKESFVHVEVDRLSAPDAVASLLTQRLGDLVLATDDYQAMRGKAEEVAQQLRTRVWPRPWNSDLDEVAAFFEWLGQKNFVFLGYREYQFTAHTGERSGMVRHGTGLGILRKEERSTYAAMRPIPDVLRRRLNEPPLLIVSKTNAESPVHRRAHMDYVGVKEIDNTGVVIGERRFLGLFTSRAYAEDAAAAPLLRRKLDAILQAEGFLEESHDYKAAVAVFNSIPKVELLGSPVDDLRAEIAAIRAAQGGTDVKVLQRADAIGRGVFVAVILPRERFSTDLYRRAESQVLQSFSGTTMLETHLAMDDSDQVRMHFYVAVSPDGTAAIHAEDVRLAVQALLRTWDDRLRAALREHFPRDQARALGDRYIAALSNEYKAATEVGAAVCDIRCLESVLASRRPEVDLLDDSGRAETAFSVVKLYLPGQELVLSEFLPVLENLGLKVFAEDALDVRFPPIARIRIHSFFVQDGDGQRLDVNAVAARLRPALLALLGGAAENDRLNTLVLRAGLEWRQVDVLRAYVNHATQIGVAASRTAVVQALTEHPAAARLLWEYFDAKLDPLKPAAPRDRLAAELPAIERRFLAGLDGVQTVMDDRILRALFAAVSATVRTTYYQPAPPDQRLALKFESARLLNLPPPHPLYEVYVHAPRVEAIHLRSAKVARGGIRLSDRPDDFRTEVLDLMKTQTVKNAVIVPAGAKGGFIVKRQGAALPKPAEVLAAYRTFISGLLDLSDNLLHGRIVPPPDVLAYDDPDPYLVVAADKGTATFSDTANELAAEHALWLGDAFASGGTHGYDHKKEGITARGAWECVRRHFHEMGGDADRDDISVIGIGDMSGDVFGNGMLLSRRLRLRAAFNHQHIFIDPTPDPARAFAERERLFNLPRSAWSDYTPAALGPGGGIFLRSAKLVALSPAARSMLGIEADQPSGEDVVRAILRMEADLLWNGGIGTYVKASDESDAAAADSANDAVRVNASELRVKVIAEGGNLGLTQRARVEFALRGGRLNTDAIDNSAGVDMSDHEVNLKIAMAPALESGELPLAERNQLLVELTDQVTRRVLAHNHRQARILSLDQRHSREHLQEFRQLMTELEDGGMLDRQLEALPDRDRLRNRRGTFLGLTRPELAVVLAHSKLALQQQLLASGVPDEAFFERTLRSYFPEVINLRFGAGVRSHRLRREIIAVELANALIDHMGAPFITRIARDTGAPAAAAARTWAIAVAVSGADELWAQIDAVDPVLSAETEARCWAAVMAAVERATKWILETQPADASATEIANFLTGPTQELLSSLTNVAPSAVVPVDAEAESLASEGVPRRLAQHIVDFGRLPEVFEIGQIAADLNVSRRLAAEVYYRVAETVELDWVATQLAMLPAEERWERRAVESLRESLRGVRRQLTETVLRHGPEGASVEPRLAAYASAQAEPITNIRGLIEDVRSARRPSLAALLVIMRALERLVADHEAPAE